MSERRQSIIDEARELPQKGEVLIAIDGQPAPRGTPVLVPQPALMDADVGGQLSVDPHRGTLTVDGAVRHVRWADGAPLELHCISLDLIRSH